MPPKPNTAYTRLSKATEQTLMVALNNDIEDVAEALARSVMDGSVARQMLYPPNNGFTSEEQQALEALKAIPNIESALRKVLADAAAYPICKFFGYADGITDPTDDEWSGIYLTERPDDEDIEVQDTSYDAEIYHRYWNWLRVRPDKGWRLDMAGDVHP